MKHKSLWATLGFGAALFFASCQNTGEKQQTALEGENPEHSPVLVDLPSVSPEFPEARLSVSRMESRDLGNDSVSIRFEFQVENYELKSQTADAETKNCNNSAQGQHIHFILNNEPYVALYAPSHELKLAKNSEHYLLAFLSRSYHESIKSPGAAVLKRFSVDAQGKIQELEIPENPMVFYSRPKGDYLGEDTRNLLFDFYVWNGSLGADLRVQAELKTPDGAETFLMDQWKPGFIQSMPMGTSQLELQLVDGTGEPVSGPMTQASGKFRLAEKEPMTP